LALRHGAEHLEEEVGLRVEVAVERARGDPGARRDGADGCGAPAAVPDHLRGRMQEPRARAVSLDAFEARRMRVGHTFCRASAHRPFRDGAPSSSACRFRWKWPIAPSKRPNSRNSLAPLARPRCTPQATARSSLPPSFTRSRPRRGPSALAWPEGIAPSFAITYVIRSERSIDSGSTTTRNLFAGKVATMAFGK